MDVNARATRYDPVSKWRMSEIDISVLIIQTTIYINSSVTMRNRLEIYMSRNVHCIITMFPVIPVKSSTMIKEFSKIIVVKHYRIVIICPW
jgi:hypothetical protein